MSSHCIFLNDKDYDYLENNHQTIKRCLCCMSQSIVLINLNTCKHTAFIRNNINAMLEFHNAQVCILCHNMLKKIEEFKKQIENSNSLLTAIDQAKQFPINFNLEAERLKIKKLNNFDNSHLQTTDSTEPIDNFDIKSSVVIKENEHIDYEIKLENDSSDFEAEVPLEELKKRKRETHVHKYEGKIRVVTLTPKELREERENLSKQEKYLKLPYRCEHCITGFDHESTWKNHIEKRHTKTKNSYQCDICKSVLNTKNSYNVHTKRHMRRLECMECGKRYTHEQSAIQHYDEHHLPPGSSLQRGYSCKECGFTTTVNRTYRYHLDKHKKKRECSLCGNTFVNDSSLKMHLHTVHRQSARAYRCEACDKTYRAKSGLAAHAARAHGASAERAYCALCRAHYASRAALRAHLASHSRHVSDADRRFICDECGAKFIKKNSLQIHINWEHLKLNTHRCVKCPKVFKCAPALRRHVNYVHNKLRPPRNKICHFCGRGFTTQNILQSHLRTHTGERPLQCQHCRATFAHSGALYTHMKLKHSAVK